MNAPVEPFAVARRRYIGGSDIAAILGCSPFTTPVELWLQKRGEMTRQDDPVLKRGRQLEPYVLAMYAEDTGRKLLPAAFMLGREPWMAANLDGATADSRVVDAKTAHPRTRKLWGDVGSDDIPVYITAQQQWYLAITGYQYADVAALIGIDDFRIYTVEADRRIQETLIEKARAFWRLVQEGIPPEIQEPHDVRLLYPQHFDGKVIEASNDDFAALDELKSVREQLKALEDRDEALAGQLQQRLGSAEALTFEGRTLCTWKTQERCTVDTKAFRAAHPDLARQFERIGTSRVFRIK